MVVFEALNEWSNYLDHITGSKGTLGYLTILALVVVGYSYTSSQMFSEDKIAQSSSTAEEEEEPDPPRNFTKQQLSFYDGKKIPLPRGGEEDKPVYLSVNTTVFDVSKGRDFYGPEGPYEMFAGKECGVALAKMSFDESLIDQLDLSSLKHGEKCELENWIEKFRDYRQYPIKGRYVPNDQLPDPNRIVSQEELAKYDGTCTEIPEGYAAAPIYIGAGTKVFDVSFGGVSFYGPGGPYAKFAGKDATRALAKMSLDEADFTLPEGSGGDKMSDLTEKQIKTLDDWIETFENKKQYPVVGRLES